MPPASLKLHGIFCLFLPQMFLTVITSYKSNNYVLGTQVSDPLVDMGISATFTDSCHSGFQLKQQLDNVS